VEFESTRMCELLVGLPDVNMLAVADVDGEPLRVHVETREPRPTCPGCGGEVAVKDRPAVELVDLALFGRRARLVWRKHRWSCPSVSCPTGSWTGQHFSDRPTDICVRSTVSARPLPDCGQVLVDGLGGDRGMGRVEPPFDAMVDVEELADLRAGEGVEHQPS
jgi:transposase